MGGSGRCVNRARHVKSALHPAAVKFYRKIEIFSGQPESPFPSFI
jgi:hypothetical protein